MDRGAFIISQAACAQAEIAAMQAENTVAAIAGWPLPYRHADFMAIPDKYLIGHNSVLDYLRS